MKIKVIEIPNSTWELEGDTFYCTHDEIEIVEYTDDHLGPDGHYQTEHLGYACADCGEPLEGSPEADRADYEAEMQIMEMLGK